MPDEITEVIRENAVGPAKASGDSGSMEMHSLADQIAVDRYMASKQAVKSRGSGLRISKLIPPGAV